MSRTFSTIHNSETVTRSFTVRFSTVTLITARCRRIRFIRKGLVFPAGCEPMSSRRIVKRIGVVALHGRAHASVENVATFEVFTLDSASHILTKIKPWEYLYQIHEGDVEDPSFIADF